MEKYEPLGVVGEGSYGVVLKCKNKETGVNVAIKKFIDSEDDLNVRKIALREIRVLRKLRHENLVSLLEVFRRRKHLYLVFEFIDHTLLDDLESNSHGLQDEMCRAYIFQILRGLGFCHDNGIIHRDVKPENVLVSKGGVVKLCDFGFARTVVGPGEQYTDYVATRWYRAPELLVGDVAYGKEVDIWAVGCLFSEMMTGEPLFPGDSDIDQLFLIAQCLGRLAKRHMSIMSRNSAFRGLQLNQSRQGSSAASNESLKRGHSKLAKLERNGGRTSGGGGGGRSGSSVFSEMFPSWSDEAVQFITVCLDPEPSLRPGCNALLRLPYFTHDSFPSRFMAELNVKIGSERNASEPGRSPFARKVKRPTILQSQGPQPTSSSPRHPPNFPMNSNIPNKGPYHSLGGGLKKNSLYQTRSNLAAALHDSLSPKTRTQPDHLQPLTNPMGIRREATFVVDRSSGGNQDQGSSPGVPPALTKSSGGSTSSTRIPSLFTRKFSSDTLVAKPRDIPASRSTPNILGESSNIVKKRLSMPQQGESQPALQVPARKFSYSLPSQQISGASQEGNSTANSHEGFTPVPVTTLTFTMNPLQPSYSNNTQPSKYTQESKQRSASPNKPYSTNGGNVGTFSSSYFPHTQHYSGFHSIKTTTPYLVSSIYGAKMLPPKPTVADGNTNEGFLPKVGTLHNKVTVSTSGGSNKGDTTNTMPSLLNNSSSTISPSFNLVNTLPGGTTNSLGRRRDSFVGGSHFKTHSTINSTSNSNETKHSYQTRHFSTFSSSNNPNYINNNNP